MSLLVGASLGALVSRYLDGPRPAIRRYVLEHDPDHPGFYMIQDVPVFSTNRRGAGDSEGFDEAYLDRIVEHHSTVLEPSSHFVPLFDEHHPDDRFDESRPKVGDLRNLRKKPLQLACPDTHQLVTLPTIFGDFRRIKPEYAARMLQGDLEHRSIEIVPGNPRISGCSLSSTVPPYFKFPNLIVELGEGVEAPQVKTLQMREPPKPGVTNAPVVVCFAERMRVELPAKFSLSANLGWVVAPNASSLDDGMWVATLTDASGAPIPLPHNVAAQLAMIPRQRGDAARSALLAGVPGLDVVSGWASFSARQGASAVPPTPPPTAPSTAPPRRRFAEPEVEVLDAATGEQLWQGTFEQLLADNAGDLDIQTAVNRIRAGEAEVTVGGGAKPTSIIRRPRAKPTSGEGSASVEAMRQRQRTQRFAGGMERIAIEYWTETATLEWDGSQASAPIVVDGRPTPYQTADARHSLARAVQIACQITWPGEDWTIGGPAWEAMSYTPSSFSAQHRPRHFADDAAATTTTTEPKPADDKLAALEAKVDALTEKLDALLAAVTDEETTEETTTEETTEEPKPKEPDAKDETRVQASEGNGDATLRMKVAQLESRIAADAAEARLKACVDTLQRGRYVFSEKNTRLLLADVAHDEDQLKARFDAYKAGLKRAPTAAPLPEELRAGTGDPLLKPYEGDPDTLALAAQLLAHFRETPSVRRTYRDDPADYLKYAIRAHARRQNAAANGTHR